MTDLKRNKQMTRNGQQTKRLLVIEDEKKIASSILSAMAEAGFDAEWSATGDEGLKRALEGSFDLVLLDVLLPIMDGFAVLEGLRAAGWSRPVLMLTSLDGIDDRLRGLNNGADDYLVKPFYMEELVARVQVQLRRYEAKINPGSDMLRDETVAVGPLKVYRTRREATIHGNRLELTLREFDLLEYLLRDPGAVRPRAKIFKALWSYGPGEKEHVLDVYIARLRTRLGEAGAPGMIETVRGLGYRIVEPSVRAENG